MTALSGDTLKAREIVQVKDVAAYVPGLNINSDSVGRSFVSIRGVGTTVIDTVQPGVGIFIDGIYQPDTSYLNTPLVDIAQVEVLRGPQGTLFGNNTLAGAINVITRQPDNNFHGRLDADYAETDNFRDLSGSISGPIIKDVLQFRIGAAYHQQDGFEKNTLAGGYQDPLNQKSLNGTVRFEPLSWVQFTLNANYDRIRGGTVPYFNVSGPTDYSLDGATNIRDLATYFYKAVNLKGDFDLSAIRTKVTAIAAYNSRTGEQGISDSDFGPVDFLHTSTNNLLVTTTGELRFDTKWSDRISTLVGLFADRSTTQSSSTNFLNLGPPTGFVPFPSAANTSNDNQAIFGTVFAKLTPKLEFSAGVRYDHQNLNTTTDSQAGAYKSYQLDPRFTLTQHWTPDIMTYASIARGSRGGGQNAPGAPNPIYRGDNVWTYETGSKFTALDRRLSVDVDVFYNAYDHFIGPNALAPSTTGVGFVAVDLNAGQAYSYGFEGEANWRITDRWTAYGSLTLLHARVLNDDEFVATTGYALASNRQVFVPDYNFDVGTNYRVPIGSDALVFDGSVVAKGSRVADSLDATSVPVLQPYNIVNSSVSWEHQKLLLSLFVNNLFDETYIESYLDKSLLTRAGVPPPIAANLVIQGDRRRYGVRASYKF